MPREATRYRVMQDMPFTGSATGPSGNPESSWGQGRPGQWVTRGGSVATPVRPDFTSGLALQALSNAPTMLDGTLVFPEQTIQHPSGANLYREFAHPTPDERNSPAPEVSWRWRFGPAPGMLPTVGWCAALEGPGAGSMVEDFTRGSAVGSLVNGAAAIISTTQVAQDLQINNTYRAAAGRYCALGVHPRWTGDNRLRLSFQRQTQIAGLDGRPDYVIDTGTVVLPGDLVTWDVTFTPGDSVCVMQVWKQRLISDVPTTTGKFTVPMEWLPWAESPEPTSLSGGVYPLLFEIYKPSTLVWRQDFGTVTHQGDRLVVTSLPALSAGESIGTTLVSRSWTNGVSGPTQTLSGSAAAVVGASVSVSPSGMLQWHQDHTSNSLNPPIRGPAVRWVNSSLVRPVAPLARTVRVYSTDYTNSHVKVAGFVYPRPTDTYGLGFP